MLEVLEINRSQYTPDPYEQYVTDIKGEELETLQRHSNGIYPLEYFTEIFPPLPINCGIPAGYSLGLDNFTRDDGSRPYYVKSHELGLTTWKDGYRYHELDWISTPADSLENLIYKYLDIITAEKKPIAFFVPPEIKTHPNSRITRWEMEWCLTNKNSINQMYFIFGLYK